MKTAGFFETSVTTSNCRQHGPIPRKDANSQRTILFLNYIKRLSQINRNCINFAMLICWLAQEEAQVPTRFMNLLCTSDRPMTDWCQSALNLRIRFEVTRIASFNVVRMSQEWDPQCMAVSGLGELNCYAPSCEGFGFQNVIVIPSSPLCLSLFSPHLGKRRLLAVEGFCIALPCFYAPEWRYCNTVTCLIRPSNISGIRF